jgi:hypothetical protein
MVGGLTVGSGLPNRGILSSVGDVAHHPIPPHRCCAGNWVPLTFYLQNQAIAVTTSRTSHGAAVLTLTPGFFLFCFSKLM